MSGAVSAFERVWKGASRLAVVALLREWERRSIRLPRWLAAPMIAAAVGDGGTLAQPVCPRWNHVRGEGCRNAPPCPSRHICPLCALLPPNDASLHGVFFKNQATGALLCPVLATLLDSLPASSGNGDDPLLAAAAAAAATASPPIDLYALTGLSTDDDATRSSRLPPRYGGGNIERNVVAADYAAGAADVCESVVAAVAALSPAHVVLADADNQAYLLYQVLDDERYVAASVCLLLFVSPTMWKDHPLRTSITSLSKWVLVVPALGESKDAADIRMSAAALDLHASLPPTTPITLVSHDGFASELLLLLQNRKPRSRHIVLLDAFDPMELESGVAAAAPPSADNTSVRDLLDAAATLPPVSDADPTAPRLVYERTLARHFKHNHPHEYSRTIFRERVNDALVLGLLAPAEDDGNAVTYCITAKGETALVRRGSQKLTHATAVRAHIVNAGGRIAISELGKHLAASSPEPHPTALTRLYVADTLSVYSDVVKVPSDVLIIVAKASPASPSSTAAASADGKASVDEAAGVLASIASEPVPVSAAGIRLRSAIGAARFWPGLVRRAIASGVARGILREAVDETMGKFIVASSTCNT